MKRLALVLAGLTFFCGNVLEASAHPPRTPCQILQLYDGDTVACDLNGNQRVDPPTEKIRLIGIDAPEMSYSRKNHSGKNQPFAVEAMALLRQWQGKTVWLAYDVRRQDKYDRTLAYVYPNQSATVSLNEALLAQGLAKVMFLRPNLALEGRFIQAAFRARQAGLGLWGLSRFSG